MILKGEWMPYYSVKTLLDLITCVNIRGMDFFTWEDSQKQLRNENVDADSFAEFKTGGDQLS